MKNRTRLRRLRKLITLLEIFPEEKFYLGEWMRERFKEPLDVVIPDNFIKIDCRTACCALGAAALDKGFRRAGLGFDEYDNVTYEEPHGHVSEQFEAGADFFGIEMKESYGLFFPDEYKRKKDMYYSDQFFPVEKLRSIKAIKPEHVIKRIKILIKMYGGRS